MSKLSLVSEEQDTVPAGFKALLAAQPMRRTEKGMRHAFVVLTDLPQRQLALLRRFTGETLLEYLVAPDESLVELYADAFALYRRGLIAASSDFPQMAPRPVAGWATRHHSRN